MEKKKLIIVEGPQGTGKTTLTNYLRENISSSNLYRLSGQSDKTKTGKEYSTKMYNALIEYLKVMQSIPMNMIFDRTFFTEEVYARLGYKEYSFTDVYESLTQQLQNLDYEIYFIVLYLKNIELYRKRLAREAHHNYQAFSIENSANQQKIYFDLCKELENTSIHVLKLAMDNFDEAYQNIQDLFSIGASRSKKK